MMIRIRQVTRPRLISVRSVSECLLVVQYPIAKKEHRQRGKLQNLSYLALQRVTESRWLRVVVGKKELVHDVADEDAKESDRHYDRYEQPISKHHVDLHTDE